MGKFSPGDDNPARREGPLTDIAVLDLSGSIAGAYSPSCSATSAPGSSRSSGPGGDPSRHVGPFPSGRPRSGGQQAVPVLQHEQEKRDARRRRRRRRARSPGSSRTPTSSSPTARRASSDVRGLGLGDLRPGTRRGADTIVRLRLRRATPTTGRRTSSPPPSAGGPTHAACPTASRCNPAGSLTETVAGAYAAVAMLGAIGGRPERRRRPRRRVGLGGRDHVHAGDRRSSTSTRQMIGTRNSRRQHRAVVQRALLGRIHRRQRPDRGAVGDAVPVRRSAEWLDDPRFADSSAARRTPTRSARRCKRRSPVATREEVFSRPGVAAPVRPRAVAAAVPWTSPPTPSAATSTSTIIGRGPLRAPRMPFLMAASRREPTGRRCSASTTTRCVAGTARPAAGPAAALPSRSTDRGRGLPHWRGPRSSTARMFRRARWPR